MTFAFRPASQINEAAGLFVSLTGTTNSGKTYSALTLARGIAGPDGKVAVLDTEGGRTLHLKDRFDFDAMIMGAPFRPHLFADAAQTAESEGYGCMLIDSFSMEWAGLGGVLDWQEHELQRMAGDDYKKRERVKMASWIAPKSAHKAMVNSLLQRRIPIVFSIRGEESVKPGENGERPSKIYKSICSKSFPFEVTVAFRLDPARKGYLDLSDPTSWKMEEAHREIFRDGDRISEEHGAALKRWAIGLSQGGRRPGPDDSEAAALTDDGDAAAERGIAVLEMFWRRLTPAQKTLAGGKASLAKWKADAEEADARGREERIAGIDEDADR